jgi:hypothetical protein
MPPEAGSKPVDIGSVERRPTTFCFGAASSWISRATSYSRNSSRCGLKNSMMERPSVEFVPASPKYTGSPVAPSGTARSPNSFARSSSSE